jgi:hypothetical protein
MRCKACGSKDVSCEARVVWDSEQGAWVIEDFLDDTANCWKCDPFDEGGTVNIEEVAA